MESLVKQDYPVLSDWIFIKGVRGTYFLFDFLTRTRYSLTDFQANLLSACDGTINLSQLAEKFLVSQEKLTVFLRKFEVENLLQFVSHSSTLNKRKPDLRIKPPYLKEVHLDITSYCNLRCRHCYQEPYLNSSILRNDLSTEEIIGLIHQMVDLNVAELPISGGEPFFREDLPEIIDFAFASGVFVSMIFTNGTVQNHNIIDYLRSMRFPIEVAISLDGDTPESHDFLRGKGTFRKTIEFIKIMDGLKDHGSQLKCVVNTIVHRRNYQRLLSMFKLLRLLGIPVWRISMPKEQGLYARFKNRIGINETEVFPRYEELIVEYIDYFRDHPDPMCIQIESIFSTAALRRKKITLFSPNDSCCEYKRDSLTVKPNGDVTACTTFTNLVLGNVRQKPLAEIWYSSETQRIKTLPIREIKECKDCPYLSFCGTGCRRMALDKKGSILDKDETVCSVYGFFHERIWPILQRMEVELILRS
jgi:radical SAM protein with 4Fe4S-binding SPASM domain